MKSISVFLQQITGINTWDFLLNGTVSYTVYPISNDLPVGIIGSIAFYFTDYTPQNI